MISLWTEFQGRPSRSGRDEPRVTLNRRGVFFINRKAFDKLGAPAAVRLFFDENRRRIGLKRADPALRNAFPIRQKDKWQNRVVNASSFCKHYQVNVDRTVLFNEVTLDKDGILCLDLSKTTSIGR